MDDKHNDDREPLMAQALRRIDARHAVERGKDGKPTKPRRGLHPLLLAGPPVANLADAYTTRRGIKTGLVREGNGVMRGAAGSDAALYATKAGIGVAASLGSELLARKGHRKLGKATAIVATALPLAAAGWNLAQTERTKKKAGR